MTSEEFASRAANLVRSLQGRITGIGDKQYSMGGQQKFEQMGFEELCEEFQAEILDGIAYLSMLYLNTEKLRDMTQELDRGSR